MTKLDELISIPKKADASQAKKAEYQNEMINLLRKEGYSFTTEKYLFYGFLLGGVDALVKYMGEKDEAGKLQLYKDLTSGKKFRNNERGMAFKVLITLLCQLLNKTPQPLIIIEDIIKDISTKSKNKENKLHGEAGKMLHKYFVSSLEPSTNLPLLKNLNVKPILIKEFRAMMLDILPAIETKKPDEQIAMKKIMNWLQEDLGEIKPIISPEFVKNPNIMENQLVNKTTKSQDLVAVATYIESLEPRLATTIQELKFFKSQLNSAAEHIESMENELNLIKLKFSNAQKEIETLKTELDDVKRKLAKKSSELSIALDQNSKLSAELYLQQRKVESKDDEISRLLKEIERHNSVISVFSTDKQIAQTEQLNLIASKLRAEYTDFKDALDMEMTIDLGENLRQQMTAVFKILAKNGIDIERR